MPSLSGSLLALGFPPLLRFLAGLRATGRLRLTLSPWQGDVFFNQGQTIAAACHGERGLVALEGIALALPASQFEFVDDLVPERPDDSLALQPLDDVITHVERVIATESAAAAVVLAPDVTVWSVPLSEWPARGEPPEMQEATGMPPSETVELSRIALGLLVAVATGCNRPEALASTYGLRTALRAITELLRLRLVRLDIPSPMATDVGQTERELSHSDQ